MKSYERCEECKNTIKKEEDEKIGECPFCGSDMGFVQTSETEYRRYYISIVMQPCTYNKIKPSVQTTFMRGKRRYEERRR